MGNEYKQIKAKGKRVVNNSYSTSSLEGNSI